MISCQVHVIKPDPAIYKALIEKYSLDPAECLFFDDMKANIEAAGKLGIGTFHVTSEELLLEKLDDLNNLKNMDNPDDLLA